MSSFDIDPTRVFQSTICLLAGMLLIIYNSSTFVSASEANLSALGTYRIDGACVRVNSETPQACVEAGESTTYPDFVMKAVVGKLSDSIRACNVNEVKAYSKSAEWAVTHRESLPPAQIDWWDQKWNPALKTSVQLEALKCAVINREGYGSGLAILKTKIVKQKEPGQADTTLLTFLRIDNNQPPAVVAELFYADVAHICALDDQSHITAILKTGGDFGFQWTIVTPKADLSSVNLEAIHGYGCD